jgi:solute carrier family 20 (sodium-dependent phosphate transporter)
MSTVDTSQFLWIVIVAFLFGFIYAFGIGANDVANAFASTVASKSLTLFQAVIAAAIFEFGGSVLLGAQVTGTIRSKIFDIKLYEEEPQIVMLGMFTSLITSTFMLLSATYFGLPVSTTHTIVGGIMGFSICAKGFSSISLDVASKIFISWILSPGISAIFAFIFFFFVKKFIMTSPNPYTRAYYTFPLILFVFIGIDMFYILYKGMNNVIGDSLELSWVIPSSFGIGALFGLVWILILGPIAKKRIERKMAEREEQANAKSVEKEQAVVDAGVDCDEEIDCDKKIDMDVQPTAPEKIVKEKDIELAEPEEKKSLYKKFTDMTYGQDLHEQSMREDENAVKLWDEAEEFDPTAEQMFTYVQVFTACLNSFAHGANDVANAIAPLSAILLIYDTGELSSKAPVEKWILVYGGFGIVMGLLFYGYKVMKSLGYKLTKLSPSRGACAELAASLFVVTASVLEIPVSSTQAIVGAVAGVGLTGGLHNIGWFWFVKICVGWVTVFFSAVVLSMGLFSFVAFSPHLV